MNKNVPLEQAQLEIPVPAHIQTAELVAGDVYDEDIRLRLESKMVSITPRMMAKLRTREHG